MKVKIYVAKNKVNNNFYVGSTKRTDKARLGEHISLALLYSGKDNLLYNEIKQYGGENFTIETIYEFEFVNKEHRKEQEQFFIDRLGPKLNTRRACLDKEQYRLKNNARQNNYNREHKEEHNKFMKEYYEKNKDKIREQQKKTYERNKDKIRKQQNESRKLRRLEEKEKNQSIL
jgi:group I intron endonuclease